MLSVVIPAYNEEAMIEKASACIRGVLAQENIPAELIFVDDGSKDATWARIMAAAEANAQVRGVHFSRNFGKEAAIMAGLAQAAGDCCVVIDCDLQHPPEKIVEMYRLWEQGYEVVEGRKSSRGKESGLHSFAAKTFYAIISRATGIDMANASDFKLLDRRQWMCLSICANATPFSAHCHRGSGLREPMLNLMCSSGRPVNRSGPPVRSHTMRSITSHRFPRRLCSW